MDRPGLAMVYVFLIVPIARIVTVVHPAAHRAAGEARHDLTGVAAAPGRAARERARRTGRTP